MIVFEYKQNTFIHANLGWTEFFTLPPWKIC